MNKKFIAVFVTTLIICCSAYSNTSTDFAKYVDPFIGTAGFGHTFPGPCLPFGMIQVSPETGLGKWDYCAGYVHTDDSIKGFAQNHLNGTGVADLGDILIYPFIGNAKNNIYKEKINKKTEKALPGYYTVTFPAGNIKAELTATERTAFHRYTFNKEGECNILIDLESGLGGRSPGRVLAAEMEMPDNQTITGHNQIKAWVERDFFYVIQFDKQYKVKEILIPKSGEKAKRLILTFDLKRGESVQIKVAISTVSRDGAWASIAAENKEWDFERIKQNAYEKWNQVLSVMKFDGTKEQLTNAYTSLYHLFIQPNNIADVDGRYRGVDNEVAIAPRGVYYSTFSLWDTYRAAHPLYTLIMPDKVDDMIQSMINHSKKMGFLPIWTLWGKENYCMIGNHAVPVIVDAYLKGFKGFNTTEAYYEVKKSLTRNHKNSDWNIYMKYGYYPFDLVKNESVSRTLESVYDDYCAAQMAKALDKKDDYNYFSKRADFYKNLLDPETKLMRGKDTKGNWRTPFNSFLLSHDHTLGGDYTEGNAWQYTWHVQHDVEGLIKSMGGKEYFATKLDSLFFLESTTVNTGLVLDVTGLIGQYAHGNEPSHHVSYLYNYAGQPWKTQELIREIFDRFYMAKPDGLCGNDDCGQMSAWYLFSAMGFYPVNPVGGDYVLGAPQFKEITINLPNNKIFTVKANGLSKKNKYVKSVTLNGIRVNGFIINHRDIINGGSIVFEMSGLPSERK